ncbi:MAG: DUF4258 domain-containing protein [Nitrospirales bacterium]
MSDTFERVKHLVGAGSVRIPEHGYDELAADGIRSRDIIERFHDGRGVEDYPDYPKGPCVLVLQQDSNGNPIHVVWGLHKGRLEPAVVVTAYRPAPEKWQDGFMRRRR